MNLLLRELLPLATLVTPNLDEAEWILSTRLRSEEDLRHAARQLHERFGCAALVKGGHLRGRREAVDIFFDGRTELLLSAPFVRGVSTHGTGCTYSAAITAHLALALQPGGTTLPRSRNISVDHGSAKAAPGRGQGHNPHASTLTNLLPQAVTRAKEFITQSIAQSLRAGRHDVLNPFWK
jgi:hydroxymethylpyrimidine/phosphomethylpyrimidine kinase